VVHLDEYDEVVGSILEYCYTGTIAVKKENEGGIHNVRILEHYTDVYCAAEKYGMPGLQQDSRVNFEYWTEQLLSKHKVSPLSSDDHGDCFKVIRMAYEGTNSSKNDLRRAALRLAHELFPRLGDSEELRDSWAQRIGRVSDFNYDYIAAMRERLDQLVAEVKFLQCPDYSSHQGNNTINNCHRHCLMCGWSSFREPPEELW
jgi:hypothetical protein